MSQNIYVGNMPFSMTEEALTSLFSQHGTVSSASVITDRETGRPRGFGFVEMSSGGPEAIKALDGNEIDGRALRVNEAKPRENNGGGGGGGRW